MPLNYEITIFKSLDRLENEQESQLNRILVEVINARIKTYGGQIREIVTKKSIVFNIGFFLILKWF